MDIVGAIVVVLLLVNAAVALGVVALHVKNDRKASRLDHIEAKWEPVIIAVSAGDDVEVRYPKGRESHHLLVVVARFARRLRGVERRRVEQFGEPLIPLAVRDLKSRTIGTRRNAIEILSLLAFDRHVAEIVSCMDDRSDHVSIVAARALCRPGAPQFLPLVLERLHRYDSYSPSLLTSLLASVGSSAVEELRAFLSDESRPTGQRAIVADAVCELRDPGSVHVAAATLTSEDPELVVSCLRLIRTVGSSTEAAAVRKLEDHEAFFVRAEVARTLGVIGDVDDQFRLLSALHDPSPWVALRAGEAMARLGWDDTLASEVQAGSIAGSAAREALDAREN